MNGSLFRHQGAKQPWSKTCLFVKAESGSLPNVRGIPESVEELLHRLTEDDAELVKSRLRRAISDDPMRGRAVHDLTMNTVLRGIDTWH